MGSGQALGLRTPLKNWLYLAHGFRKAGVGGPVKTPIKGWGRGRSGARRCGGSAGDPGIEVEMNLLAPPGGEGAFGAFELGYEEPNTQPSGLRGREEPTVQAGRKRGCTQLQVR